MTVMIALLQACASQYWYNAAQSARQNECTKLADTETRAGCVERANLGCEQYGRAQQDKPKD
jgi:hypothetical protein